MKINYPHLLPQSKFSPIVHFFAPRALVHRCTSSNSGPAFSNYSPLFPSTNTPTNPSHNALLQNLGQSLRGCLGFSCQIPLGGRQIVCQRPGRSQQSLEECHGSNPPESHRRRLDLQQNNVHRVDGRGGHDVA